MTQKIDAVDTFTETRTQRLETSSGGLGNIKGFYHLKKKILQCKIVCDKINSSNNYGRNIF